MCEYQGNPLARVTLVLGLPYLLVNRALEADSKKNVFCLCCLADAAVLKYVAAKLN